MATLIEKYTYGFEDVSIVPCAQSAVGSRKDVDTSYKLTDKITLQTPIIASPMADVCDDVMAYEIFKAGGIGCIHRFQSIEEQSAMVHQVFQAHAECMAAVGTTPDFIERAEACIKAGAMGIIVDVAFLNQRTVEVCKVIKDKFPNIYLISGNVATAAGYMAGWLAGLDAVRVGIGNGQACRTSRVTGVGVGLVTSLMEAAECNDPNKWSTMPGKPPAIICDGGMDIGGSLCKALAAGAHIGIMGRSFAATWEAPGKMYVSAIDADAPMQVGPYYQMVAIQPDELPQYRKWGCKVYKEYRGSASMEAQMTYKSAGDIVTSEGVASLVQVFGSVADVLGRYNGALRSSMSYVGADNLDDYRQKAVFRLVGEGVFSQQKARGLQTREITI